MMDFLVQKAYAYNAGDTSTDDAFTSLLRKIVDNIVNPIIYLVVALAVVYFLWGVFNFIKNADNADKRSEGYQHMIWGVIGVFIMISARGIIFLILKTMGL